MSKKDAKPEMLDLFSALPPGFVDNPLTKSVRASAQQIWAAGLGAFAKAGGSGKMFESLVNEGLKLQQKTQASAQEKIGTVADELGAKARKQWSQLESLFEQRVQQALNSMGMPTVTEVRELRAQLDALSAEVAALKGKPAAKPAAKAASEAPAKTPAKKKAAPAKKAKAAVKKAPAKKAGTPD